MYTKQNVCRQKGKGGKETRFISSEVESSRYHKISRKLVGVVKTERTKGTAINIPGRRIRNVEKKYMYENNLCLTQ